MSAPLLIARTPHTDLFLLPGLANRHGLITGATGTGKTARAILGPNVFCCEQKRRGKKKDQECLNLKRRNSPGKNHRACIVACCFHCVLHYCCTV